MTSMYSEIVDELSEEVCFEMHRKLKLGLMCVNCESMYSGNTLCFHSCTWISSAYRNSEQSRQ